MKVHKNKSLNHFLGICDRFKSVLVVVIIVNRLY